MPNSGNQLNNVIYIYTTKRNEPHDEYKIGETTRATSVRIKEQDGTSNSHGLEEKYSIQLNPGQSDKEFHKKLESLGWSRTRQGREWFQIPFDDLKRELHKYVHNVKKLHSWGPRKAQKEAINAILRAYPFDCKKKRDVTKFLLDAKPRFGKTVTAAWVMEEIRKYKKSNEQFPTMKVLVLTNFPHTDIEWEKTLNDHVDFANWSFHHAKRGQVTKANMFVFASMQKLMSEDRSDKEALDSEWIYKIDWNAIVIDEEHYGTMTPRQRAIIDRLKTSFVLSMSGTPFRSKILGLYEPENVFSFGYVDERRLHNLGVDGYEDSVEMRYILIDPDEGLRKKAHDEDLWDKNERPTMAKIFAANETGEFIRGQVAEDLMTGFFFGSSHDPKYGISPFGLNGFPSHRNSHILVRVKHKNSALALTKLCDNIVGNCFDVINVAGREDAVDSVELNAKITRAKNKGKGSITVTCGAYCTGTTVKPWNVVLLLDDLKSPSSYVQTNFRCQNPKDVAERGKQPPCFIVDLCPWRSLHAVYKEMLFKADGDHGKAEDLIREWLLCAPMHYAKAKGVLQRINDVNVVLESASILTLFHALASSVSIDASIAQYAKYFNHFKGSKSKPKIDMSIADSWDKGVDKKMIKENKTSTRKERKKLMEQIKTFLKNLARLLIGHEEIKNTDDIINNINNEIFKSTGLAKEQFIQLLDEGCLNKASMDNTIYSIYKHLRDGTTIEDTYELLKIYNFCGEDTVTPLPIVDRMVANQLLSKNHVVCDPACGTGQFIIRSFQDIYNSHTLKKRGHSDKIATVKYIMENQVRGFDINPLQITIARRMFKLMLRGILAEDYEDFEILHGDLVKSVFKVYNILDNTNKKGKNMEFDAIIGNPPFNKGLDREFIEKSLKLLKPDGALSFVHPANFLVDEKPNGKFKKFKALIDKYHYNGHIIHGNYYFGIGLYYPCVISTFSKKNGKPHRIYNEITDNFQEVKKIDEFVIDPNPHRATAKSKVFEKIKEAGSLKDVRCFWTKTNPHKQNPDHEWYVVIAQTRGHITNKTPNKFYDDDFYTFFPKEKKYLCPIKDPEWFKNKKATDKQYFGFSEHQSSQNFISFLCTKIARFCLSIYKMHQSIRTAELQTVPNLDWSIKWTDELLCKELNFTIDEWNYIDNFIPNYYDK